MAQSKYYNQNDLTCKPLDSFSEILSFSQNPPSWRHLCKELQPHSKHLIRNLDLCSSSTPVTIDAPVTFCHFNPDAEEVERYHENTLPKTLVCHDMANGYHDDSIIDGTTNYDAYTFYNWAGIDIFCYFSHHLVTIPPLGWINVGHAHGVKVIGTLITEWGEGVEFWDKALVSDTEYQNLASALVAIAKTLNFDGWLLNIENKVSKPDKLLEFVQYLHRLLHQEVSNAVLIWYDSVTVDGHLNWQNGLNAKNKAFFDVCDGFFTNYSWSEKDVMASAALAGERVTDLFIGLDVWGRNFYGGGQFNLQQAVELVYSYTCSMAIFAPAWTHEAYGNTDVSSLTMTDDMDRYAQFLVRDRALWGSIWPYLNTRVPCTLPFQTSFCRGQGLKRRLYGEVLCPGPWYNLRHMQYQPNSAHGPHGYLLSTVEKIIETARHGITKDSKGIIKYRDSFQRSRIELHSVQSRDLSALSVHSRLEIANDESHGKKKKMTKAIKNLFRLKSNKIDSQEIAEQENKQHERNEQDDNQREKKEEQDRQENKVEKKSQITFEERKQDKNEEENENQENSEEENKGLETNQLKLKDQDKNEVEYEGQEINDQENSRESKEWKQGTAKEQLSFDIGAGWSLLQMSVNIKLGQELGTKKQLALARVPLEHECLELYYEDSFIGGACLKVNPSDELSPEHRMTRLFHCDFYCERSLVVCVVTKPVAGCEQQYLNIKLHTEGADGQRARVALVGRELPQWGAVAGPSTPAALRSLYPLNVPPYAAFRDLQKYLLLHEPAFYISVENSYGWIVRYYEVPLGGARVTSINCRTATQGDGPVLLGYLGLCHRKQSQFSAEEAALPDVRKYPEPSADEGERPARRNGGASYIS